MRIEGPRFDNVPNHNQPANQPIAGQSAIPGQKVTGGDMRTFSLSRYFEMRNIPQPPGLVRSLEEALARAGLAPSSLDRNSAIRALLLHRHGLPLTESAITGELASQPAVSEAVAELMNDARALLVSGNLGASGRNLVMNLLADLADLYNRPGDGVAATRALVTTIDTWAFDTETLLVGLLTGDVGLDATQSGVMSESTDRMLDFILSPQPLDRLTPSVRGLIAAFRQSVEAIQSSLTQTGQSTYTVDIVHDILMQFESNIPAIAALAGVAADGGQAELAGILREMLGKRLALLQSRLESYFPVSSSDSMGAGSRDIAGFVNRSGLMFEWQLLAWYRAGKNPAWLRDLYHRDLKGILKAFTENQAELPGGKRGSKALDGLRLKAAEALKRIETQQLTNLLDRYDHERSALWEMPLMGRPENGQALIRASGNEPDVETDSPRTVTLSFEVDTTSLGTVSVTLTITGKAMTITVEVAEDRWIELGDHMADEISDTLGEHGFSVGKVIFALRKETLKSENNSGVTGGEFVA